MEQKEIEYRKEIENKIVARIEKHEESLDAWFDLYREAHAKSRKEMFGEKINEVTEVIYELKELLKEIRGY